jgi:bifunctional non-homologous end joining protein LigD
MSETVVITHPDKLMFPDEGITKGDLVEYYDLVAAVMLPHIERRPITMERFNRGTGEKGFFQKNVSRGFPDWLERVEVPKKGGTVNHPIVTDARSIRWLANQNCVTMHVWPSRAPRLERPDVCVFDLDPSDDDTTPLRRAALALRDLLAEIGLTSWVKTTGSKGYHIVVPLDDRVKGRDAAWLSHTAGTVLVRRDPDHLTQEFSKADRGGRIYVDTGRNGYSATFAAAYTVRARPGAPISAPCTWAEVERGTATPRAFTLRDMPERIASVGDVWEDLLSGGQSLKDAIAALRTIEQKG